MTGAPKPSGQQVAPLLDQATETAVIHAIERVVAFENRITIPGLSQAIKDAVLAVLPAQPAELEWAVQERTFLDGPWDRLRERRSLGQALYTEAGAREEAARRVNGLDPATWRRVVHRGVGSWAPDAADEG